MGFRAKKILVTGGAGFLGSNLVGHLLKSEIETIVLDDFSNGKMMHLEPYKQNSLLKIIKGDVVNRNDVDKAMAGCDTVIHFAVLDLRQSIKEPVRVNEVIVDGTLNCLEAARKNSVELFLNCSSSEVFGTADYVPMDEKHPLRPETPYAASKVAQDMQVFSYGRTYGLPWLTVRPFNMYGPNSHWQGYRGELIPKMIVRAMNKKPLVIFGEGDQTRDFIYVDDAAKGVMAALQDTNVRSMDLNLCSGKETSVKQIALEICKAFDLDPNKYIERQEVRPGDVKRHLGSNALMRKTLGFTPEIDLQEGLKRTIKWFKSLNYRPEQFLENEVVRSWE